MLNSPQKSPKLSKNKKYLKNTKKCAKISYWLDYNLDKEDNYGNSKENKVINI